MGIELRLRAEGGDWPPAVVTPETFLARLAGRACIAELGVVVSAATGRSLELRRAGAEPAAMPSVSVQIEERGFYVLDDDAVVANHVVAEIVRYLLGSFERVTIVEP